METMGNVKVELAEDGILTITVDVKKRLGESKSGKSLTVASTYGNLSLAPVGAPDLTLGLNLYQKK